MQSAVVFAVFVALSLWLIAIWPGRGRKARMEVFSRQGIAHRGLHNNKGAAPENSLAAFRLAVEKGYGIELDVRLTGDGDLVIMHDPTLKRACRDERAVNMVPAAELRKMTLFTSKERIPLFREALEVIGGKVPLVVEIKAETYKEAAAVAEQTAFWLDSYEGPMCIESFNPAVVLWFKRNRPETLRGQLAERFEKKEDVNPFGAFLLSWCICNFLTKPDFIAYNKKHASLMRFRVQCDLFHSCCAAWTIRSEKEWRAAAPDFDIMIFEKFEPQGSADPGNPGADPGVSGTEPGVPAAGSGNPALREDGVPAADSGGISGVRKTKRSERDRERDMNAIVRLHFVVSGRVQAVGFRYRAVNIAHMLGVTGWVRNLDDGRVEMELQGDISRIREMMKRLGEQRYIEIDQVEEDRCEPVPSEYEFKVRY